MTRLRSLAVIACAAISAAAAPASAQDTPFVAQSGSRPLVHADGSYIFNFLQYGLVFEGQIAPRVIVFDTIGRSTRRVLEDGAASGWQASITPMVRLRMFAEDSSPVRTPSYMPKVTLQHARFANLSRIRPEDDEDAYSRGPIRMWLFDVVPFGHHSNGQNNCLFLPRADPPGGPCFEPAPADAADVNLLDGSFSTNYAELMVHYGRLRLDSEGAPETDYATRSEWRIGAGIQVNPKGYLGGSIEPALAERYGTTRVIVEGMAAWRPERRLGRIEIAGRLEYLGDVPEVPSVVGRLEVAALPRKWGGAGVFVRYYGGQDYYNLRFATSISRLIVGATFQRDTFLGFAMRSMN
jgi:hypothetical protein